MFLQLRQAFFKYTKRSQQAYDWPLPKEESKCNDRRITSRIRKCFNILTQEAKKNELKNKKKQ